MAWISCRTLFRPTCSNYHYIQNLIEVKFLSAFLLYLESAQRRSRPCTNSHTGVYYAGCSNTDFAMVLNCTVQLTHGAFRGAHVVFSPDYFAAKAVCVTATDPDGT
jgi:hypothetical protein